MLVGTIPVAEYRQFRIGSFEDFPGSPQLRQKAGIETLALGISLFDVPEHVTEQIEACVTRVGTSCPGKLSLAEEFGGGLPSAGASNVRTDSSPPVRPMGATSDAAVSQLGRFPFARLCPRKTMSIDSRTRFGIATRVCPTASRRKPIAIRVDARQKNLLGNVAHDFPSFLRFERTRYAGRPLHSGFLSR